MVFIFLDITMTVFFRSVNDGKVSHASSFLNQRVMFYLKTTETCQLNCDHCFTNGTNGKRIFFNPSKTLDFFQKIAEVNPNAEGNISFHGGEPMLAPIADMDYVATEIKKMLPNVWWSITTNLTYKLTDDIKTFFFKHFKDTAIGTSWDYDIRFSNEAQEKLWRSNLSWLIDNGFSVTLMVSISKALTELPISEFFEFVTNTGVKYLHLERITMDGNAVHNQHLFPSNAELDAWFDKMWEYYLDNKDVTFSFSNEFLNSILTVIVNRAHSGCRCRECEQKILTINADGSIGGCPNSAPSKYFANIDDNLDAILFNPQRMCNINDELTRSKHCWTCDVIDICNGDCHQLNWEDASGNKIADPNEYDQVVCPAPKTLMRKLKMQNDIELYKNIMNGFMGGE